MLAEASRNAEHRSARPAVVLVVDDDDEVREIVADFLTDFGHRVLRATGGQDAMRQIRASRELDLLITDIRMPDMSGIDLARVVSETRPGVRIILISGYFVPQDTGWPVLHKPFRMLELEQAVNDVLDG